MSNSRSSSPDTIDIEVDSAPRNVRPRLSHVSGGYYHGEPSNYAGDSDPSEEPMEEEDPSEDEEIPLSVHLRSPSPLPSVPPPSPLPSASPPSPAAQSSSTALPSPLPPASPPSPVAPSAPLPSTVPSLPDAPPSPVLPSLRFSTRNHGVTTRWDWMPTSLRAWRNAEQLPVVPMPYGLHTPTLTLTQEPMHHTMPVLIARLRTHDEQLEDLEHGAEVMQQQLEGVEGDLSELRDEVVTTHMREVEDRQEIAALRQEVAALRQELAELRAERERARADTASPAGGT